eukprot:4017278-Amphidinium_carterae.1
MLLAQSCIPIAMFPRFSVVSTGVAFPTTVTTLARGATREETHEKTKLQGLARACLLVECSRENQHALRKRLDQYVRGGSLHESDSACGLEAPSPRVHDLGLDAETRDKVP